MDDLTQAADEDLLVSAREGQEQAIETLLDRYRHYARAKTRSYFLIGADKEDIIQEGMIGLYKAIRDFQDEKNISFRAFAELCITRQIVTAIRTAGRHKHLPLNSYVSLSRPVGSEDDDAGLGDLLPTDVEADPAELLITHEEVSVIRSSLGRVLSRYEADVLRLYMEGRSYVEIADALGTHVKSIDNALQRMKRKLSHHLRGGGEPAETGSA